MAQDKNNLKELDLSKLTQKTINEAIKEVKEKWHDLGNGIQVKEKLTKKMEEKLADLVEKVKSGNWKDELEEAIVQMITYNYSSNESLMWYGHLVTQCEIKRDLSLPAPAGVTFKFNKYELFINPLLFGLYSIDEQIAILKHEMLHIINLHVIRRCERNPEKWNYATDISINQLITNIPEDSLQPEKFGFEKNLNAEQYYEMLPTLPNNNNYQNNNQQNNSENNGNNNQGNQNGESGETSQNNNGNSNNNDLIDNEQKLRDMIYSALAQANKGMLGDHSKWQESEGDERAAKEITRQMVETASNKSRGQIPSEAIEAVTLLKMKEQINWKKELRKIVGNRKAFSRLTIKRNDRRFPTRKDLRGKTRDHVADILVILDVSGSMSNDELIYGLNEVRAIAEKAGAGVKIIQIDTEPKLVEDFDPKTKNFTRRGFGGTYIYPAVDHAMKNKIRFDAIVVITDGFIEDTWDGPIPRVPFIWLVTEDKNNLAFDISLYPRMKAYTLEVNNKKI